MSVDVTTLKPAYDPNHAAPFGPAVIEKRTHATSLTALGTSFMEFTESGFSAPWTLQYEETIYVIEGQLDLFVVSDDGATLIEAAQGELLALPEGTTVRYGAEQGTRLLLSITPVSWRARAATAEGA